jgi:hypothetical protein
VPPPCGSSTARASCSSRAWRRSKCAGRLRGALGRNGSRRCGDAVGAPVTGTGDRYPRGVTRLPCLPLDRPGRRGLRGDG